MPNEDQAVQRLLADLSVRNMKTEEVWHSGRRMDETWVYCDRLFKALTEAPVVVLKAPEVVELLHQILDDDSEWWTQLRNVTQYDGVRRFFLYRHCSESTSIEDEIRELVRVAMNRAGIPTS